MSHFGITISLIIFLLLSWKLNIWFLDKLDKHLLSCDFFNKKEYLSKFNKWSHEIGQVWNKFYGKMIERIVQQKLNFFLLKIVLVR
jgi:hypothetical protein